MLKSHLRKVGPNSKDHMRRKASRNLQRSPEANPRPNWAFWNNCEAKWARQRREIMDSQPITGSGLNHLKLFKALCSRSCQPSVIGEKQIRPASGTHRFWGEIMYLPSKPPQSPKDPQTHGLPKLAAEEECMISQHIEQLPRLVQCSCFWIALCRLHQGWVSVFA